MFMTDDQKDKISGEKNTDVTEDEMGPVRMVRPEMVDMARRFMMMPKIRQTPLIQQKQFLLQKGLRDDEINEAMKELPLQQNMRHINNTAMEHEATFGSSHDFLTKPSGINILLRITKYAMIITSFSYTSWHLLRSYVLPRFFDTTEPVDERIDVIERKISEMQRMMGDITTELLLKLQTVIDKQSIMDRVTFQSASALDDLKKSVETLSATLASKEQQLPIRTIARKRNATNSRVFPRTEDPSGSDIPNNERSEEALISTETSTPAEERNGSVQVEKNVTNSES
ncbi:unnamed protein product [Acanthocheilonema viteae]|uniref:Peroxisomal membrane protein PEX14 n=1 Tax=Acanthocheilonema viteae TaxID=6277 RepID=A0A498SAU3_ACAVI|nr:unnamed protein product [Acanthocheilonema viteae]